MAVGLWVPLQETNGEQWGDDEKQREDIRRSGTIVEGAMAKNSLSFILTRFYNPIK